jgi:signal transduction histidine kinase
VRGEGRGETKQLSLSTLHSLVIQVQDDGKGLNENGRRGIGLLSMRERAEEVGGLCEIMSSEQGVQVTAVLPIAPESNNDSSNFIF